MSYSKSGKLYSIIPADKQETRVKLTSAYYTPYSKMAANKLYSFVCMLISPLCLIFTSKFFCFLYMLAKLRGLINMQTKEQFIGRHFGIRCTFFCRESKIHWRKVSAFEH